MRGQLFRFPNPVNEVSARLVATGVVAMALLALSLQARWLLIPIAYGFVARTLSGPTFSPLGQLVTRLITPRLSFSARYVPGPPKRFAQGIGAALSLLAVALAFGFGQAAPAFALMIILALFATLEAAFGFCAGCTIFALLMRWRLIPAEVCLACNDLRLRPR